MVKKSFVFTSLFLLLGLLFLSTTPANSQGFGKFKKLKLPVIKPFPFKPGIKPVRPVVIKPVVRPVTKPRPLPELSPWQTLAGRAKDIGVGANGSAWVIGTNKEAGGYGIYRWNGKTWQKIGGSAVMIDVGPDGNAGVVNNSGAIFLYNGKGWTKLPGAAKDIGIGTNGSIWIIGTNKEAGGYGIYRWLGSDRLKGKTIRLGSKGFKKALKKLALANSQGGSWQKINGSAVRIDVDDRGNAWVVNNSGNIYRFDGKKWVTVPGKARDIGIGGDGSVWVLGHDKQPGGYGIYRWDGKNWQKKPGGAVQISVDNRGLPWVVNSGDVIFRFMPISPKVAAERARKKVQQEYQYKLAQMKQKAAQDEKTAAMKAEQQAIADARKQAQAVAKQARAAKMKAEQQKKALAAILLRAKKARLSSKELNTIKKQLQVVKAKKSGSIRKLYMDLLGREPDKKGYEFWQGQLASGKTTFAKIQQSFLKSPEFKKRAKIRKKQITSLFKNILKRKPDAGGLKHYLAKLEQGTPLARIKREILGSKEYKELQKQGGKRTVPKTAIKKAGKEASSIGDKVAAKVEQGKTIALSTLDGFKNLPFANVIKLKEANVFKKVIESNAFIFISGKASLFGLTDVKAVGSTNVGLDGSLAFSLGLIFEQPWSVASRYSNKLPAFVKPAFDILKLNQGAIILSTAEQELESENMPPELVGYFQPVFATKKGEKVDEFTLELGQGVNIYTGLRLDSSGPLQNFKKILKSAPTQVLLHGLLTQNPQEMFLKAKIGAMMMPSFMPKNFKSVQPTLEITGQPSLGLEMALKVGLPPKENQPVDFFTRVSGPLAPSPDAALNIAGGMEGMWENPFNITGLSVGDVTLKAKIVLSTMSPAFGMGGTIHLGSKEVSLAAVIPVSQNVSSAAFKGSINEIGFQDLILLAAAMDSFVKSDKLPIKNIGLRNVSVSIAAVADDDLGIDQGVTVKGDLDLVAKKLAFVNVNVSKESGIIAMGSVKNLKLGPLSLTGDGMDRKKGTKDDGAVVDIALNLLDQHFFIHGKGKILGIVRELKVLVEKLGMGFKFTDKIFNLYQADVEVKGALDVSKPEFYVKAQLKTDFFGALENLVDRATAGHTPDVVKKAFDNVITVDRASFEGGLQQLMSGKTPKLEVALRALGKSKTVTLQYDFSNNAKSLAALVKKIADIVIKEMKEFALKVAKFAKEAAEKVAKVSVKAYKETEKFAKKAADKAATTAKKAAEKTEQVAKTAASKTKKGVVTGAKAVAGVAKKAGGAIKGAAKKTGSAIKGAAKKTGSAVKKGAKKVGSTIKGWFSDRRLKRDIVSIEGF
ncbi:tectonin domain-containing protein [Candidatus Riflebacteria bacterium]